MRSRVMAAVRGALRCAGFFSFVPRSVNPRTAATFLFDSRLVAAPPLTDESVAMLKIVPDPPLKAAETQPSIEALLLQTSEYLVCALTVAQQTVLLNPKPAGQVMTLAAMHEIENAQSLIEMALSRVQSQH